MNDKTLFAAVTALLLAACNTPNTAKAPDAAAQLPSSSFRLGGDDLLHLESSQLRGRGELWTYSNWQRSVTTNPIATGSKVDSDSEELFAAWTMALARLAAGNIISIQRRYPPGSAGLIGPKPLVISPTDVGNDAFDANGAKKAEIDMPATWVFSAVASSFRGEKSRAASSSAPQLETQPPPKSAQSLLGPSPSPLPDSNKISMDPSRVKLASTSPGYLLTEWISISGKRSGISVFEHIWIAEIRYHVRLISKFGSSDRSCVLIVFPELRERPNLNYPWQSGDVDLGRAETTYMFDYLMKIVSKTYHDKGTDK